MINYFAIFSNTLKNFHDASKWSGAPFANIKVISNTKVGDVGQHYIETICEQLGFKWDFPRNRDGSRATQSPWDIVVNGVRFELKTATEDVSCAYQFNHIRYHRDYDAVICLGVSPDNLFFNVWSKADITTGKAGKLVSMEKGANASYKLTKRPGELLEIDQFHKVLVKFIRKFR